MRFMNRHWIENQKNICGKPSLNFLALGVAVQRVIQMQVGLDGGDFSVKLREVCLHRLRGVVSWHLVLLIVIH